MNIIPNENKVNIPLVTPLNLIGDIMKCKDCKFITEGFLAGISNCHICNVEPNTLSKADPEKTACWKFKLSQRKDQPKPIVTNEPVLEIPLGNPDRETKIMQNQIDKLADNTATTFHGQAAIRTQANIGDAVAVHYKGLHRIEAMVKLPNGLGVAIVTGPDGTLRMFSQNECDFVKRIQQ